MPKILTATVKQDSPQTVSIELREQVENRLIGYLEATLVPTGARIEAWNADDSDCDGQIIVRAEREQHSVKADA